MFFIFFLVLAIILFGVLVATAYLTFLVRHSNHSTKHKEKKNEVKTLVVLGSGGHTTEMLGLISELGPQYKNRVYVIAETDKMSEQKVRGLEHENVKIERIPRSREVGQSYITSVVSTLHAIFHAFQIVYRNRPDLVLLNGPGTCIPIAFAAAFFDLIRLSDTTIIYEESICRVEKLSMSGAILYYSGLIDDVLVQWPSLKSKYPRCTYIGDLKDE